MYTFVNWPALCIREKETDFPQIPRSGRDDKEVPLSHGTSTLQSVEPPTALLGDVQEHPVPDGDGTVKTVVLVQRPPSRFKAMCSGEKNGAAHGSSVICAHWVH